MEQVDMTFSGFVAVSDVAKKHCMEYQGLILSGSASHKSARMFTKISILMYFYGD